MPTYKDNPRYNVVSFRVTDEEREDMENIATATRTSMSTLMREALLLFRTEYSAKCKVNY